MARLTGFHVLVPHGYNASLRLFFGLEGMVHRRNDGTKIIDYRYARWEYASLLWFKVSSKTQVLGIVRRSPHCLASSKSEPPRMWMSGDARPVLASSGNVLLRCHQFEDAKKLRARTDCGGAHKRIRQKVANAVDQSLCLFVESTT